MATPYVYVDGYPMVPYSLNTLGLPSRQPENEIPYQYAFPSYYDQIEQDGTNELISQFDKNCESPSEYPRTERRHTTNLYMDLSHISSPTGTQSPKKKRQKALAKRVATAKSNAEIANSSDITSLTVTSSNFLGNVASENEPTTSTEALQIDQSHFDKISKLIKTKENLLVSFTIYCKQAPLQYKINQLFALSKNNPSNDKTIWQILLHHGVRPSQLDLQDPTQESILNFEVSKLKHLISLAEKKNADSISRLLPNNIE